MPNNVGECSEEIFKTYRTFGYLPPRGLEDRILLEC